MHEQKLEKNSGGSLHFDLRGHHEGVTPLHVLPVKTL